MNTMIHQNTHRNSYVKILTALSKQLCDWLEAHLHFAGDNNYQVKYPVRLMSL